jgi:hypothetical protein
MPPSVCPGGDPLPRALGFPNQQPWSTFLRFQGAQLVFGSASMIEFPNKLRIVTGWKNRHVFPIKRSERVAMLPIRLSLVRFFAVLLQLK